MLNAKVERDARESEDEAKTRKTTEGALDRTVLGIQITIIALSALPREAVEWSPSPQITPSTINLLKAV